MFSGSDCFSNSFFEAHPLYQAVYDGDINRVKSLLNKRNVNVKYKSFTLAHIAASQGNEGAFTLLIECGARIDEVSGVGTRPLFLASVDGKTEVAALLIKAGADVNAKNSADKATALHVAAQNGHIDIVEVLIEAGANVNAKSKSKVKDRDGITPLYLAAQFGREEIVKLLIDEKADVSGPNGNDYTPLHAATRNGHEKTVELLISTEEININAEDNDGNTAIHIAAIQGYEAIAALLLTKNPDINAKNKSGNTPLTEAARYKNRGVVGLLVQHIQDSKQPIPSSSMTEVEANLSKMNMSASSISK